MAEPPSACIVHAMPGRVRLRLSALRGNMAGLSALALAVAELPGVAGAQATAATGSLLVLHGGTLDGLLGGAAAAGLFLTRDAAPHPGRASSVAADAVLPAAGAVAAAGLAALQLLRREALPPALTLGVYAFRLAQVAMRRAAGSHGLAGGRRAAEIDVDETHVARR